MMQGGIVPGYNTNLPGFCMDSENSENDERAIRGAIVELDDLICSTTRRASSQNTSRGRIALAKAFRMNR